MVDNEECEHRLNTSKRQLASFGAASGIRQGCTLSSKVLNYRADVDLTNTLTVFNLTDLAESLIFGSRCEADTEMHQRASPCS